MKVNKCSSTVMVLFLVLGAGLLSGCQSSNQINPEITPVTSTIFESQTNAEGPVSVTVTPQELSKTAVTWDFEIDLNTHSTDISQDLTQVSTLIDNEGNEYTPTVWDGDTPGGHHLNGVLKFPPIEKDISSIELKITDVGEIPERSFKWSLVN